MPIIEITAMTFGPYGIGHHDGKTVMVPGAVPGDRVEVEIISQRRGYSLGKITQVLEASPQRRIAPCPFLPRCGGCDWQQINYEAQLRIKADLIARELERSIGIELDRANLIEPAPAEYGYRSRIRLQAGANGELGYFEAGSNNLVAIDRCIVAESAIRIPNALARALGRRFEEIEVIRSGENEQVLVPYLKKPADSRDITNARRILQSDPTIAGIVLRGGDDRIVLGDARTNIELEPGLAIEVDADLFSQVNRALNQSLVREVMRMAELNGDFSTTPQRERLSVLDLFCGAGNFALPAARRGASVTGVDSDAPAIAAASQNATRLKFATTQFIAMKAAEVAQFLHRARYRPKTVILDPPRTGALQLMQLVVKLRPDRIIYVSCDVTTLARDLRELRAGGYEIDRVRAFDFFPNTHHAEVAARAVLT
ncbi:MAG TPA: class I SAM-dependent RNA methyltransferase [Candidatus Binataceae bacterium]